MYRVLALIAVVGLLLAACESGLPEKGWVDAESDAALSIGVMTVTDGPLAGDGQVALAGARLATEQAETIHGRPLRLVVEGGGCDAAASDPAAVRLIATPRLIGVIGPLCSAACVAAATVLERPAIAMITPRCTDIAVTRQGYDGVFRTSWTDAVEAAAAARYLTERLHIRRRTFLVHDGTIYGRGLRDTFRLFYGKTNLSGNDEALTGSAEYGPVVRAITKSSARAVFYAGFPGDAARFLQELRAAGIAVPVVMTATAKERPVLLAVDGRVTADVYIMEAVPIIAPAYHAFRMAYLARFGAEPGQIAAAAFDATWALINGATAAAEPRSGGRLRIDRRQLLSEVAATDLDGATGRVRFLANGDRIAGAAVRVWQIRDGAFVLDTEIDME